MDPFGLATRIARRQHGAINGRQARDCGLTRHQIRQLVRSGRWMAARYSVYTVAGAPNTWEQRAWCSLLACGVDAVLSHLSAAYMQGLIEDAPERIDITVSHRTRNGTLSKVPVHRAVSVETRDRRTAAGFPVTCPARTLVDLAAVLPHRALGRAVDKALLRGLVTIAVVRRYIKERNLRRKRGVALLIKLLEDREFGVPESELERRTLELIEEYGLPKPSRQWRVGPHRIDFAYPEKRVVIEVDGRATHGTSEAFDEDPVRQNELVLQGLPPLRFTWKHITQDPDYVAETIRRAVQ